MLLQSRKRTAGSPSTRASKRARSPSPEVRILLVVVFDYFLSAELTHICSQILARTIPGGTTADASSKVPPTRSSPSKPKAPRRLKKKVKQDPPPVVFSIEEDEESEDLAEGSLHQRRSRKPSQAAAQVFITRTFPSDVSSEISD